MPKERKPGFESRIHEADFWVLKGDEYVPYTPGDGGVVEFCRKCLMDMIDQIEDLNGASVSKQDDGDYVVPLMTLMDEYDNRLPADYVFLIDRLLWEHNAIGFPIKHYHFARDFLMARDSAAPDDTLPDGVSMEIPCDDASYDISWVRHSTFTDRQKRDGFVDHGCIKIDQENLYSKGLVHLDDKVGEFLKESPKMRYYTAIAIAQYLRNHRRWRGDGLPVVTSE